MRKIKNLIKYSIKESSFSLLIVMNVCASDNQFELNNELKSCNLGLNSSSVNHLISHLPSNRRHSADDKPLNETKRKSKHTRGLSLGNEDNKGHDVTLIPEHITTAPNSPILKRMFERRRSEVGLILKDPPSPKPTDITKVTIQQTFCSRCNIDIKTLKTFNNESLLNNFKKEDNLLSLPHKKELPKFDTVDKFLLQFPMDEKYSVEAVKIRQEVLKLDNQSRESKRKHNILVFEMKDIAERLDENLKRIGIKTTFYEQLIDESKLINRINEEDVQLYAAVSAIIYDIPNLKLIIHKESQMDDSQEMDTIEETLNGLNASKKYLLDLLKNKKQDLRTLIKEYKNNLVSKFDINLENCLSIESIIKEIDNAIKVRKDFNLAIFNKRNEKIHNLQINSAQELFKSNKQAATYRVLEVFDRNYDQPSGAAIYNDRKNKFIVVFAGSKSVPDWKKNFLFTNHTLSVSHGFLTNVSIHEGIGSHLNENFVPYLNFIKSWLNNYNSDNHADLLEITFVGHSLGGSLAEMFGAMTKQICDESKIKCNLGIVTFGSPNIIDPNSIDTFNQYLGGIGNDMRFINENDYIASILAKNASPATATIILSETSIGQKPILSDLIGSQEAISTSFRIPKSVSVSSSKKDAAKATKSTSSASPKNSFSPLSPPLKSKNWPFGTLEAHSSHLYYHSSAKGYVMWNKIFKECKLLVQQYKDIKKQYTDCNNKLAYLRQEMSEHVNKLYSQNNA